MLRFFFLVLLLANALVFTYHQGHLNELIPSGREPARLQRQLNADAIQLVSVADLQALSGQSRLDCVEIGNFTPAEASLVEPQLTTLLPEQELVRREVFETSSHMVLIPPQGGRSAAEKWVAQLNELGITDFYVLQEGSPHRWGISLGVFKSEERARARLAFVVRQGVQNAQIVENQMKLAQVVFQLRGEPAALNTAIDSWLADFPRQEKRTCE